MKTEVGGMDIDCPVCSQTWTLPVMVRTSDTRTGTLTLALDAERFRAHVRTHVEVVDVEVSETHVDAAEGPPRCQHGVPLSRTCFACKGFS